MKELWISIGVDYYWIIVIGVVTLRINSGGVLKNVVVYLWQYTTVKIALVFVTCNHNFSLFWNLLGLTTFPFPRASILHVNEIETM